MNQPGTNIRRMLAATVLALTAISAAAQGPNGSATYYQAADGKSGATGEELAAFMAEQGCTQAYNLDGGNSALMVFHGENYSDKSTNAERSVSDIIYFATLVDFGLDGE